MSTFVNRYLIYIYASTREILNFILYGCNRINEAQKQEFLYACEIQTGLLHNSHGFKSGSLTGLQNNIVVFTYKYKGMLSSGSLYH